MTAECLMCELERALIGRADEMRVALMSLTPADRRYEVIFRWLVDVDADLRSLRGRVRR